MKRFSLHILIIIISVFVSLLLVETTLITIGYLQAPLLACSNINKESSFYNLDKELIYRLNYKKNNLLPGQSKNEYGIQTRPDTIENSEVTPDTFTILTLGDSFTYGHNLRDDETYPAQLEALLIQKGYTVNVFNAGTPGYGVDQEYVYAKRIVQKYQPNLVIINLHENDIFDSNDNCLFKYEKTGQYTQVSGTLSNIYIQTQILLHSPELVKKSNTLNLLLKPLSSKGRKNLGCSYESFSDAELFMVPKIVHLISSLQQELPAKTSLMLTMVPLQPYFTESVSNEEASLLRRQSLLENLRKDFQVIDANSKIAELLYPELLSLREGIAVQEATSAAQISMGDDTVNFIEISNPKHDLFLDDEQEPESPFGLKHPNRVGNFLFAQVVADEIVSRYIHESLLEL